jgi:hypothetical protein
MRRLNFRKRVAIAIAIVTMLATGIIWEVRRVRAFNPQPDLPAALQAQDTTPILMPPVIPLSQWEGPFFDFQHNRLFTVINKSPNDFHHFRAYGVELDDRKVVFQIDCNGYAELAQFKHRLSLEIDSYARVRDMQGTVPLRYGSAEELDRVPPALSEPSPSGGDAWAETIVKLANANIRKQAVAFENGL